jgi:hypothetical protein
MKTPPDISMSSRLKKTSAKGPGVQFIVNFRGAL